MIHVFYHSADLDGHCSGAICKMKYPAAVMHPINYGDPFPWDCLTPDGGDSVIMVDFSLPLPDMDRLSHMATLHWIDHHFSAIKEADIYGWLPSGKCVLDITHAACELCWQTFFMDTPEKCRKAMPLAIYWLGRYDIWKHEGVDGALEFQYGMRMAQTDPSNPGNMTLWQELFQNEGVVRAVAEDGELILRYENEQNKKFASAFSFECELDGLKCIAVNKGFTNSKVFDSVYDPAKHDAMLSFCWRGGQWTVSLYSTKPEVDCSVICKARGGGGHKGASGFQTSVLDFLPGT